jgi:hypothetical protein
MSGAADLSSECLIDVFRKAGRRARPPALPAADPLDRKINQLFDYRSW